MQPNLFLLFSLYTKNSKKVQSKMWFVVVWFTSKKLESLAKLFFTIEIFPQKLKNVQLFLTLHFSDISIAHYLIYFTLCTLGPSKWSAITIAYRVCPLFNANTMVKTRFLSTMMSGSRFSIRIFGSKFWIFGWFFWISFLDLCCYEIWIGGGEREKKKWREWISI